ncbi:MAG: hypothetical protein K8J08_16985 [Thermoanaerobaculia bacterium]|nr:hypothetical protein [Thermoanaerobaculia bacterium]
MIPIPPRSLLCDARRHSLAVLAATMTLAFFAFSMTPARAGVACGKNEPGFPIPQCCSASDSCSGNVTGTCPFGERWPTGLRPGLPDTLIAPERDSTQYASHTIPYVGSGHELFRSVDIAGSRLFVAYTNGISAWNIANSPESPLKLDYRDGVQGGFLSYPTTGENDAWIRHIDAIAPVGSTDYIVGVAARLPVGLTLWSFSTVTNTFTRLYQNKVVDAYQVRLVESGGRVYAFAATDSGGVRVYDATKALDYGPGGCLDSGSQCAGVRLGRVGGTTAIPNAEFIDTIQRGGTTFLVASDFLGAANAPLGIEVWSVPSLTTPGTATRRYAGGNSSTHGLAAFQYGANYYLGAMHKDGANPVLDVFDLNACTTGSGSCTLPLSSYGSKTFSGAVHNANMHILTYSSSQGAPFLYHGASTGEAKGPAIEHLLDLSVPGVIKDITEGGATYTEECGPYANIDYFGYYNENNSDGLQNVNGWSGKFNGQYFYRAAYGVLDVHVRDNSTPIPTVTTTVSGEPPFWFDVPISFSATAQNCTGPENWEWFVDGQTQGVSSNTRNFTFNLCPSASCPPDSFFVTAEKQACQSDPGLQVNGVNVSVEDPRPDVQQVNIAPAGNGSNSYPLCTVLTFTADVDGRPPFTLGWEVRDASNGLVTSSIGSSLVWDTTTAVTTDIFADGFETGDTAVWGAPVPPALFDVNVVATNSHDLIGDTGTVAVTLTSGAAVFKDPALTWQDLGAGSFSVQAQAENATEYRFEFADPENGSAVGCQHYASCVVVDWSGSSEATYNWTPPNTPGMYGVTVSIRGCNTGTPPTASILLDVTPQDPVAPEITDFDVNAAASAGCSCALGFCNCTVNSSVSFTFGATSQPTNFLFDWDNDSVFEQSVPGTNSSVTHTYTTIGVKHPKVKAVLGVDESTAVEVDQSLTINNS